MVKKNLNRLINVIFAFTVGYALWSLSRIITTFAPDFSVYYRSSLNLVDGVNIYRDNTLYTGLGYPPYTLIPYLPLLLLPYGIAQSIWIVVSFVAFCLSVYLSIKLVNSSSFMNYIFIWTLAFWAFPTRFTFGMGQVNYIALFFILSALIFRKKRLITISSLTFLFLLKPHFMILLPLFILIGYGREIIISIAWVSAIAITTGFIFGWHLYGTYFNETVTGLLVFRGRDIYYNQGIGALFSRLFPLSVAQILTVIISFIVYAILLRFGYIHNKKPINILLFSLPVFLLIEPLSWQHHYIFLLPVFVTLWYLCNKKEKIMLSISYFLIATNIKNPDQVGVLMLGPIILSHVGIGNIFLTFLATKLVRAKQMVI